MSNRITAITPQKKNPRRFNVFIENQYAFSLSAALAMTLHPEERLSEDRINALKNADETDLAFQKALYYLKFRPRSKAETIGHLEKKQFGRQAIAAALKKLENYGYIDDTAFAAFWVESRKRHRPRGLFALRYELREKGIDKGIIDKALFQYDEIEPAWRAVSARLPGWSKLTDFELKTKIYNFLKQKGFAFETCEQVFHLASENRMDKETQ